MLKPLLIAALLISTPAYAKPRGMPPGMVMTKRAMSQMVYPTDANSLDQMKLYYLRFARLAKALLDNHRTADRAGLKAADQAAYEAEQRAKAAAEVGDINRYAYEYAKMWAQFRLILAYGGVK